MQAQIALYNKGMSKPDAPDGLQFWIEDGLTGMRSGLTVHLKDR